MSPAVERLAGRHAEPEELVAYRAHRLGEEEVERLQDHLALCSECTELLLDLASFEAIEPRLGVTPVAPDREIVEGYAALMAVVEPGVGGGEAEEEPDTGWMPAGAGAARVVYRPLPWTRTVLPWAVAFSMALVAVGMGVRANRVGVQTSELRHAVQESKKNFAIYNYEDLGGTRGESSRSENIDILVLVPPDKRDRFSTYELEIQDLHGKVVESFTDLEPNNTNRLAVRVDRSRVDAEQYRFVLYGQGPEGHREDLHLPPPGS